MVNIVDSVGLLDTFVDSFILLASNISLKWNEDGGLESQKGKERIRMKCGQRNSKRGVVPVSDQSSLLPDTGVAEAVSFIQSDTEFFGVADNLAIELNTTLKKKKGFYE